MESRDIFIYPAPKKEKLADVFYKVFASVYPSDSYNQIYDEFNYKRVNSYTSSYKSLCPAEAEIAVRREIKKYIRHPITLFTSFFCIPNHCEYKQEQTRDNIENRFRGWQDDQAPGRTTFNHVKTFFSVPANLILAIFGTARNLIKLVTEFIPCLMAGILEHWANRVYNRLPNRDEAPFLFAGFGFAYLVISLFHLTFELAYFVGKSITSPIKGVETAFKAGVDFGGPYFGVIFALASITTTVLAYTLLLPLIFTAGSLNVGIDVAVKCGDVFANLPVLSHIGSYFAAPILSQVLGIMILTPALTALATIGAIIGVSLSTAGTIISKFVIDKLNDMWWNDGEKRKKSYEIVCDNYPSSSDEEIEEVTTHMLKRSFRVTNDFSGHNIELESTSEEVKLESSWEDSSTVTHGNNESLCPSPYNTI